MYRLSIKLVDREIWDSFGHSGTFYLAWIGIKHDGSTWTRVGDGQEAEMDPLGWFPNADLTGNNFQHIIVILKKDMKLIDAPQYVTKQFICEKEIV